MDLINDVEEARIRQMWSLDMWPERWSADDINADEAINQIFAADGQLITQPLLVR